MLAYLPVLLFVLVGLGFGAVTIGLSTIIVPRRENAVKNSPYECGVEPIGEATERFSVRFYLVAILFLIFDVETVFLLPWAILFDRLALVGFIEMVTFIAILVVGYAYAWRRGALAWV